MKTRFSGFRLARIRRMTHSFAAHLPRFSYNIQHVMLIQLRRLWRTLRVNRMARYSGSISTVGCCSSFADRWSPPMPVYFAHRELDDALGLTTVAGEMLADARTGKYAIRLPANR